MISLRSTRHCAIIIGLILALGACALAQSQPSAQPPNAGLTNQLTSPDSRGTNESPLVVEIQSAANTDAEVAQEQRLEQAQVSDRQWTRGLAIVTTLVGLLQLAAISFQVRIAGRQNQIIEKQNAIMTGQREAADTQSDYMRDGLEETRKTADAARLSAIAAHNALALDRPFLELTDGRVEVLRHAVQNDQQFPAVIQILFDIHNFGHTAARLDIIEKRWRIWPPSDRALDTAAEHPGAMVAPGSDFGLYVHVGELTDDEVALLKTRALIIEVSGRLLYTDQFGNTHRKKYAWFCQLRRDASRSLFHPITMAGYNEEEGWGK